MSTFRLSSIIRSLFYLLFLVTPWLWWRYNSELFEYPKMVFVYLITIAILGFWLLEMVNQKKLLLKKTPFDVPFILFFFSQVISTILSIDPHTSFWGYYSRFNGGLASTTAYLLLYYAYINHFDNKSTKTALTFVLTSALGACLYALPEHFGHSPSCIVVTGNFDANCWVQDVQTRIFGTFGQPNWLAAYIITLVPSTLAFSQIAKSFSKKILLFTVYCLLFLTLIFTGSRSGFVAFLIGVVVYWTTSLALNFKKTYLSLISFSLITSLSFFLFGSSLLPSINKLFNRNNLASQNTKVSGTLLESGDLSIPTSRQGGTESGQIRQIVWQGAIDVFRSYPLFGSGVETFAYSYYQFRPIAHNVVSEWDFLYNKAHNEFLNFAATTGSFGLSAYLLIICSFFWFLIKHIYISKSQNYKVSKQQIDEPNIQYSIFNIQCFIAFLSGSISLAVSNFFGFSTVPVSFLFFLLPGFAFSLLQIPSTTDKPKLSQLLHQPKNIYSIKQYLGFSLSILIGGFLFISVIRYYQADLLYAKADTADSSGNISQAITYFQKAISLNPNEPKFHNDYADTLSKGSLAAAKQQNQAETVRLAQLAFQESARTLRMSPQNLTSYKTQAGVFIRLSEIDPDLLNTAAAILNDAISLAPTDAKLYYNLALIYADQEKTADAQKFYEKAVNLKPNYEPARMELGDIYRQIGQNEQAIQQYRYILEKIAPDNTKAVQALQELTSPDKKGSSK